MLLTEEEAKARVCPQAIANAGAATHAMDQHCVGSACMAWRHGTSIHRFEVTKDGKTEIYTWDPRGHPGFESASIAALPRVYSGYCGLAGKP